MSRNAADPLRLFHTAVRAITALMVAATGAVSIWFGWTRGMPLLRANANVASQDGLGVVAGVLAGIVPVLLGVACLAYALWRLRDLRSH